MKYRLTKKRKAGGILLLFLSITLILGIVWYYGWFKKTKEEMNTTYAEEIESEKPYLYYVNQMPLHRGEILSEEQLVLVEGTFEDQLTEAVTKEDFGKRSLLDLTEGTPLFSYMFTDNSANKDTREAILYGIREFQGLKEGDYADIRIVYPNGEDYIVLSKKQVMRIGMEEGNYSYIFWLSEQELLWFSSAKNDVAYYPNTELYAVLYIEPQLQEASAVTYLPNNHVLTMYKKDNNIIEKEKENSLILARKELESRLNVQEKTQTEENWVIE